MRKTRLTVIALCAMLLCGVAVHALGGQGGGNPPPPPSPICTRLQSRDVGVATSAQQVCIADLTKNGCGASLCSLGSNTFPATGQTTVYAVGVDDGAIKAGAALSYTDNGDGTITDNNTKLMWEKKDGAGRLHDVNNQYPWSGLCQDGMTACGTNADCSALPGTALCTANDLQGTGLTIFQWVAQLNAAAFADHTDWRVPNIKELQSIVDYQPGTGSLVAMAFKNNCTLGCTVTSCSCTEPELYWSATTVAGAPNFAWGVGFHVGAGDFADKANQNVYVRAVRSGL